jgi:hypothetical protein
MEVLLILLALVVFFYFVDPHVSELKCSQCGLIEKVEFEVCSRCGRRKYEGHQ